MGPTCPPCKAPNSQDTRHHLYHECSATEKHCHDLHRSLCKELSPRLGPAKSKSMTTPMISRPDYFTGRVGLSDVDTGDAPKPSDLHYTLLRHSLSMHKSREAAIEASSTKDNISICDAYKFKPIPPTDSIAQNKEPSALPPMQYEPIPPTDSIAQNEAPAATPPIQYEPIPPTDSIAQNNEPSALPPMHIAQNNKVPSSLPPIHYEPIPPTDSIAQNELPAAIPLMQDEPIPPKNTSTQTTPAKRIRLTHDQHPNNEVRSYPPCRLSPSSGPAEASRAYAYQSGKNKPRRDRL
ncbi:hypothetical protein T492DRAFT_951774, partial [Pavlovales sp. CCMP2436]